MHSILLFPLVARCLETIDVHVYDVCLFYVCCSNCVGSIGCLLYSCRCLLKIVVFLALRVEVCCVFVMGM